MGDHVRKYGAFEAAAGPERQPAIARDPERFEELANELLASVQAGIGTCKTRCIIPPPVDECEQ
jgi:hypothetical protein